jgi:hypothetical protein
MTCANCGTLNVESAAVCAACGVSLAGEAPNATVITPNLHGGLLAPAGETKAGVGGWLLLFCIGLTFLGPLWLLARAVETTNPFIRYYDLTMAAFSLFVGINVWAVKPRALLLVTLFFLVELASGAGSSLIVLYYWMLHPDSARINNLLGKFTGDMLRLLISVGIWWWYFKVSKRVRATFGSNL